MTQNTNSLRGDTSSSVLAVTEHSGELVVDSRLIAGRLGIEHHTFLKTVYKFQSQIEQRFGILRFQVGEIKGRGQPEKYALLTEPQATILMTFSRNTDQVVDCKLALVEAFEKAKRIIQSVIPPQPSSMEALVQSIPALAQVAQSMAQMERRQQEQEKAIAQLVTEKASLERWRRSQELTIIHLLKEKAWMEKFLMETGVELFGVLQDVRERKQKLAAQDTQLQQHEQFLSELKREKHEASRRLEELPPPAVEAPPLTIRQLVRRLVNDFSSKTGVRQADLWRRLYQELYYRCGVNLSRRAKRKNQSRLDIIEEVGLLDNLYAIASEILV